MEKKYSLNRRTSPEGHLQSEPQISTFKNQNVVFKIHTAKGQQNYNAKTFPAKFSINICNQPNELGSGFYNRGPIQSLTTSQQFIPYNKKQFQNMKTERAQTNFDLQNYERQLKIIYEDKKKCDNLIMELQETCHQYQRQNQEYMNCLNQKNSKIQQLQQKILMKERSEAETRQYIINKQVQARQLRHKIKAYEVQIKKLKQMFTAEQKQQQFNRKKLQDHIIQLEMVINQKQETIKNLSNFNNQITKKVLDQQSYSSSSHVKQMQKWLKTMNKKFQNAMPQNTYKQNQKSTVSQLLSKSQGMSQKINQLEKLINYLGFQLKKSHQQNKDLLHSNEQLKKDINRFQSNLCQKQIQKQYQQRNFRRTLNTSLNQQQRGIVYEGTVKVKMENLLIEKDKRISSLQTQLLDTKKQNSLLKTKIYQLDHEKQLNLSLNYNDQFFLKKARSLGSFNFQKINNIVRNDCIEEPGENKQEIYRIISQCNSLTQTLGNFMQTRKNQRQSLDQFQKQGFTQSLQFNQSEGQNINKMKQLMRLQKQTLSILQTNMRKSCNSWQQSKWQHQKKESTYKNQRDRELIFPQNSDPTTQRIYKPDYEYKRRERSQKSCYFN